MVKGWIEKTCPSSCEESNTQSLLDSPSTSRSRKERATCWPQKPNKPCACITCWFRERLTLRNVSITLLIILLMSLAIWGIAFLLSDPTKKEQSNYSLNGGTLDDAISQGNTNNFNDNSGYSDEDTDINADSDEIHKHDKEEPIKIGIIHDHHHDAHRKCRLLLSLERKTEEHYGNSRFKKNMYEEELPGTNKGPPSSRRKISIHGIVARKNSRENLSTDMPQTKQMNSDTVQTRIKPNPRKGIHYRITDEESIRKSSKKKGKITQNNDDSNALLTESSKKKIVDLNYKETKFTNNDCLPGSSSRQCYSHKTNKNPIQKSIDNDNKNKYGLSIYHLNGIYRKRNLLSINLEQNNINNLSLENPKTMNNHLNYQIVVGDDEKNGNSNETRIESIPQRTPDNYLLKNEGLRENVDKRKTVELSIKLLPKYDTKKMGDINKDKNKDSETKIRDEHLKHYNQENVVKMRRKIIKRSVPQWDWPSKKWIKRTILEPGDDVKYTTSLYGYTDSESNIQNENVDTQMNSEYDKKNRLYAAQRDDNRIEARKPEKKNPESNRDVKYSIRSPDVEERGDDYDIITGRKKWKIHRLHNGKQDAIINSKSSQPQAISRRNSIKGKKTSSPYSISNRECKHANPETAKSAQLMEKLVTLLEQVVDNQVSARTCLHLPPDLRVFLVWLTSGSCTKSPMQHIRQDMAKYPPMYPKT